MRSNPAEKLILPNGVELHKNPDFKNWFYYHRNTILDKMVINLMKKGYMIDPLDEIQALVERDNHLLTTLNSSFVIMRIAYSGKVKLGEKVIAAGNVPDSKKLFEACEAYAKLLGCTRFLFSRHYVVKPKRIWKYNSSNNKMKPYTMSAYAN